MATTSGVRLRKAELFHRVGYTPFPEQIAVHKSKAPRRIVACGVRFGKSTIGVHEAIAALLEPRDQSLGWLVAPTYDLTQRIFKRVVETLHVYLPHRVREFDARNHRIVIANLGGGRSELRAKSADSYVSLLGESLDWLIVDEASRLRSDIWEQHLAPRLLDRRGWALLLSTPAGMNYFYKLYRRGKLGRDPGFAAWSLPTWTNPHLPADVIEAEKARMPADTFRQEYGAEFLGEENEPCELCKGPAPGANCSIILIGLDQEPLTCPECRGYIGEDGLTRVTLWPNGERHTIILCVDTSEPTDPPELPL